MPSELPDENESDRPPRLETKRSEAEPMRSLILLIIAYKEARRHFDRGQTMTEYALILAAVAIAVFVAYTSTGNNINTMVSWTAIDHDLLGT
jgi:Flp pilus assembly pilin Flp